MEGFSEKFSEISFQSLVQWIKDLDDGFVSRKRPKNEKFQSLVQWIKDLDITRRFRRFPHRGVSILGLVDKGLRLAIISRIIYIPFFVSILVLVDKGLRHMTIFASVQYSLMFQSLVQWIKDLDCVGQSIIVTQWNDVSILGLVDKGLRLGGPLTPLLYMGHVSILGLVDKGLRQYSAVAIRY